MGHQDLGRHAAGIEPENVRAISRYIGGAFGSKGPNPRTAWIAVASKRVGRPVKLVPTRDQGFTIATCRAETRQSIKLGATREGKLVALSHEGWEVTSRPSGYNVAGVESTARMYACDNIATSVNVVHADRATPGFMRAPPETPYMFALKVPWTSLLTNCRWTHRAAARKRHTAGSRLGITFYLQIPDEMLRSGGCAIRLEQARRHTRYPSRG